MHATTNSKTIARYILLLIFAALVAACATKKEPAVVPEPAPTPTTQPAPPVATPAAQAPVMQNPLHDPKNILYKHSVYFAYDKYDVSGEYRPLVEIPHARSETARRYRFDDGVGEIGIIAPVSHPFCGHCSRIRITSDGKIRTCLFSVWDHDLHAQMRRGASDEELEDFIRGVIQKKEERHHIGEPDFVPASRTMVHIGG